jgi:hypothetical protein
VIGQTIAVSTVIDVLPESLWHILEPIERHVDWMADAESITFETDQTRGVGTRFVCETRIGPLRLSDRMSITEWVPGHAMGVRHQGLVTGSGRFTLSQRGPGSTHFVWRETLRFPWWMGGPLAGLLGGGVVLRAIWRRNLRTLKALAERN